MALPKSLLYCCVIMAAVYLASVAGDGHERDSSNILFPSVISCNYTEVGDRTCLSCSQALYCFSNNVGLLWQCGGFLPNCHKGLCSAGKPKNCTTSP